MALQLVHHSGGKKLGIESKSTLYTEQVEFIESASYPRRLGSFMRQKVPGKILIEKAYYYTVLFGRVFISH